MRPPSEKADSKPAAKKEATPNLKPTEKKKKKAVIISAKSYDPTVYSEELVAPSAEPVSPAKPASYRPEPVEKVESKGTEEISADEFPVQSSSQSTARSTSSTLRRQVEQLREREAKMEEKARSEFVDRDTQEEHIESLNDEIALFLAAQQEAEPNEVVEEDNQEERSGDDDVIGLLNGLVFTRGLDLI